MEPRTSRPLLHRRRLSAEAVRESKLSAQVLAALRRVGRTHGASLHEEVRRGLIANSLDFRETVQNEVEESEEELPTGRSAAEKRRLTASSRRRKAVSAQGGAGDVGGLSYLERESVGTDVQQQYASFLKAFLKAFPRAHPTRASDSEIDAFMVEHMNLLYLMGHDANVGDKLIAAWTYQFPEFGKRGRRLLPRVTRTLKGWHRHCPARSRTPLPWIVVAMICTEMMRLDEPAMAFWVLLGFFAYLRPSEIMHLRQKDLVPPVAGVSRHWAIVVAPSEAGARTTKVGEQDDSVMWDSPEVQFFGEQLRELRGAASAARIWNFSYADLVHVWRKACKSLNVNSYVPYQLRHGGPSYDRVTQRRSLEAIQKRGRWKQLRSVMRYEKAGRVAQEAMRLSLPMRKHGKLAVAQLEQILSGRLAPPPLPAADLR